jgi:hypothetical protein
VTVSQTALDPRARARQGFVGQIAAFGRHVARMSLLNSDPQAAQVDTVTVTGATNDKTYTITINGIDVSYTADGTATIAEIADGLAAAVEAEASVRGQVSAASDAVDTVTLTGQTPGLAFTIAEADAQLTTASVTAAASASAIPFGRLVVAVDDPNPDSGQTPLGRLATEGAFSTQTATLTATYAAAHDYTVIVRNPATGAILASVKVAANTDDNTTATDIEAALAAALPANTVDEAVATNVVTLTSEVDGFEFEVTTFVEGGGAGALVLAETVPASIATSLHRAAIGISEWSRADEAAAIGDLVGEYPANHGFLAMTKGLIYVDRPGAVSRGDSVFVELAAGDDSGKLFTAGSSTRVELGSLTWEADARDTSDGTATVRVDLA